MHTIASLLQTASEAEIRYKALLLEHPPGTYSKERNDAFDLMERALFCACWMEQEGLSAIVNVGPFMGVALDRGQRARIKKGAQVFSTHPQVTRAGKTLSRAQVVKVHDLDRGYIDQYHGQGEQRLVQGKVTWVGTGGYWFWTDVNNIEPIAELPVANAA